MRNEWWCTWCTVNIGMFPKKRFVGLLYHCFLYNWFCACIPVFWCQVAVYVVMLDFLDYSHLALQSLGSVYCCNGHPKLMPSSQCFGSVVSHSNGCMSAVISCLVHLAFACFLCQQSAVASCLVHLSSPTLCPSFLLLPSLCFFSFFPSTSFPLSPLSTIARVTTPYSPPWAGCHTLKYLPIRLFLPLFLVLTCGLKPL